MEVGGLDISHENGWAGQAESDLNYSVFCLEDLTMEM